MNNTTRYKYRSNNFILTDSAAEKMAQMECQIPDFSEMADSNAEHIAMRMEFAAKRTREISTKMAMAKDKDISTLWHERHCFIGKLAKDIREMESIETEEL
jgi:hypothetical protein